MIDGKRYTATLPTKADARVWVVETRAAAARRHGAASVTFAAYGKGWLARFIDDARRLVYAHPSILDALAADPRVVLTGLATAEHAGARLVATDDDEVEGYVAEGDVAGLGASYGLVDAEVVANVVLRLVDDAAQVPRRSGMAAAPVVGLDLWETGDARASEQGQRLFTEVLETFRGR